MLPFLNHYINQVLNQYQTPQTNLDLNWDGLLNVGFTVISTWNCTLPSGGRWSSWVAVVLLPLLTDAVPWSPSMLMQTDISVWILLLFPILGNIPVRCTGTSRLRGKPPPDVLQHHFARMIKHLHLVTGGSPPPLPPQMLNDIVNINAGDIYTLACAITPLIQRNPDRCSVIGN